MPTSLETITTEPPKKRNITRVGIHTAIFVGYTLGFAYVLGENMDKKVLETFLPIPIFFGYGVGLMALQEGTSRLMDKVSMWYHR